MRENHLTALIDTAKIPKFVVPLTDTNLRNKKAALVSAAFLRDIQSDRISQLEDDLWLILAQACTENDYDYIRKICFEYCNLWQQFWDKQIDNLQYEPYKKLA